MKVFFRYTLLFLFVSFCACKKVIQLDLSAVPSQLVVEARLINQSYDIPNNSPMLCNVQLTISIPFYNDNTFPWVGNAKVRIMDVTNNTDTIFYNLECDTLYNEATHLTINNIYYTNPTLVGIPGHTYILDITAVYDNKTYTTTAKCTMPKEVVAIDSIHFTANISNSRQTTNNNEPDTVISPLIYFQDPPEVANYYNAKEYIVGNTLLYSSGSNNQVSNTLIRADDGSFLEDDNLFDGKYQSNAKLNNRRGALKFMYTGDSIVIQLCNMDKNAYTSLEQINTVKADGGIGGLGVATPANPTNNLSNGALGFFTAETVSYSAAVVPTADDFIP